MSPLACPAADSISGTATMFAGGAVTSAATASRSGGGDSSMKPPATRVPSAGGQTADPLGQRGEGGDPGLVTGPVRGQQQRAVSLGPVSLGPACHGAASLRAPHQRARSRREPGPPAARR